MFSFEDKVADTARKAGLMTASAALTCVGAAFLTAAAWLYLSTEYSAVLAAVIIGLIYLGGGVIMLALALSRQKPRPRRVQDDLGGLSPMQLVLVSFLQGLNQGRNTKRP